MKGEESMSRPESSGMPSLSAVEDLLERLRAEINAQDDKEVMKEPTDVDELIEALQSTPLLSVSHVQRGIDQLLEQGEGLDPAVRAKLLVAARRALETRAQESPPLPVCLERARVTAKMSPASVGEALALAEDEVLAFERGERRITELPPEKVATWAREVEIDREVLRRGLTTALGRLPRELSYAHWSHANVELSDSDRQFSDEILTCFDHPDS